MRQREKKCVFWGRVKTRKTDFMLLFWTGIWHAKIVSCFILSATFNLHFAHLFFPKPLGRFLLFSLSTAAPPCSPLSPPPLVPSFSVACSVRPPRPAARMPVDDPPSEVMDLETCRSGVSAAEAARMPMREARQDFFAGTLAGVALTIVGHPFGKQGRRGGVEARSGSDRSSPALSVAHRRSYVPTLAAALALPVQIPSRFVCRRSRACTAAVCTASLRRFVRRVRWRCTREWAARCSPCPPSTLSYSGAMDTRRMSCMQ